MSEIKEGTFYGWPYYTTKKNISIPYKKLVELFGEPKEGERMLQWVFHITNQSLDLLSDTAPVTTVCIWRRMLGDIDYAEYLEDCEEDGEVVDWSPALSKKEVDPNKLDTWHIRYCHENSIQHLESLGFIVSKYRLV